MHTNGARAGYSQKLLAIALFLVASGVLALAENQVVRVSGLIFVAIWCLLRAGFSYYCGRYSISIATWLTVVFGSMLLEASIARVIAPNEFVFPAGLSSPIGTIAGIFYEAAFAFVLYCPLLLFRLLGRTKSAG